MMLRHLLWKDSMAIRPLVGAILMGIVSFNAMVALVTYAFEIDESVNIFVSFWAMMPNLVALGVPEAFARHQVGFQVSQLRFEQIRCDRFLDRLTRLLLQQLDEGLPLTDSSPQFLARHRLWTEVSGPRRYPGQDIIAPIGKHWTSSLETRIDRLKARSAARPQGGL